MSKSDKRVFANTWMHAVKMIYVHVYECVYEDPEWRK